jgi:hypothetical protein
MIRVIAEEVLLFLLPFAVFAFYLVLRRRSPLKWHAWSDQALWLVLTGLGCVILALVIAGLTDQRRSGPFEPTHLENGRVVPGQFR